VSIEAGEIVKGHGSERDDDEEENSKDCGSTDAASQIG
jgi:hypothetical protein